jgi:hypothetical protein
MMQQENVSESPTIQVEFGSRSGATFQEGNRAIT